MTDWGSLTLVGLGVVFAGCLLDWLAVSLGWKKIRPVTKVTALVLLILWALLRMDFHPVGAGWLLLLALGFGLLGDILLLVPERYFKWGLGAFLLGHIVFLGLDFVLIARGMTAGQIGPIPAWKWAVVFAVVGLGLFLFNRMIIRRMAEPRPGWTLRVALYIYAFCLTSMMIVGFLVAGLFAGGSLLVWAIALGGTLFFISDLILAYNRFVRPLRLAHLWIMTTYHLAQFFLTVGLLSLIPG